MLASLEASRLRAASFQTASSGWQVFSTRRLKRRRIYSQSGGMAEDGRKVAYDEYGVPEALSDPSVSALVSRTFTAVTWLLPPCLAGVWYIRVTRCVEPLYEAA